MKRDFLEPDDKWASRMAIVVTVLSLLFDNFPPQWLRKRVEGSNEQANDEKGEESCEWRLMRWWNIEKLSVPCQVSPKTCFSYRANSFGDKILMKKVEKQASSEK